MTNHDRGKRAHQGQRSNDSTGNNPPRGQAAPSASSLPRRRYEVVDCMGSSRYRVVDSRGRWRIPGQVGILREDRSMELLQRHAGLDAQLFIENLAQSVIRRERVALPPTPVKRKHPLRL